jgi:hypothetical protein
MMLLLLPPPPPLLLLLQWLVATAEALDYNRNRLVTEGVMSLLQAAVEAVDRDNGGEGRRGLRK